MRIPKGYKRVYAVVAKDPAPPEVLSDILGLVGIEADPLLLATLPLDMRVQAQVWAATAHSKASDNIVRRHPKPPWLPDEWEGPRQDGDLVLAAVGSPSPLVFPLCAHCGLRTFVRKGQAFELDEVSALVVREDGLMELVEGWAQHDCAESTAAVLQLEAAEKETAHE
ncbi:MAG TPA: hypothetical protein VGK73_03940 [Polyangiaceae bacterium]